MRKLLIVLMVLLLIGCGEATYQTISADDAKTNMEEDSSIILLDVRTQMEFDEGHIPEALLHPLDELSTIETVIEDKEATIYVYCRSGRRSQLAAEQLLELGYESVYDLGGIITWPYDIVKE